MGSQTSQHLNTQSNSSPRWQRSYTVGRLFHRRCRTCPDPMFSLPYILLLKPQTIPFHAINVKCRAKVAKMYMAYRRRKKRHLKFQPPKKPCFTAMTSFLLEDTSLSLIRSLLPTSLFPYSSHGAQTGYLQLKDNRVEMETGLNPDRK